MDLMSWMQETSVERVESAVIADRNCTRETPIIHGFEDVPIYGTGKRIQSGRPPRTDSQHMIKIGLKELLPLEEYDMFIVLLSGGKDSIACYYKLIELGVPKEKIELWHHDIDGGNPGRRMDWPVTQAYVRAFAQAEGVPLRVSYRKDGFFGELYRIGASEPVYWEEPDTGETKQCRLSEAYLKCQEIKEKTLPDMEEQLSAYGRRLKFPAKSGDLSRRWCSAYLKKMVSTSVISNLIEVTNELVTVGGKRMAFPAKGNSHQGRWCSGNLKAQVANSVTSNLEKTAAGINILVVSGERRGESAGRAKYNEMELHAMNAQARAHRLVHLWHPVIDYTQKDVWEVLKRHRVRPHPCYYAGWPRCSCAACIFSTPELWAGYRELFPVEFEKLCEDERILNFTLDNKCPLPEFIGDAKSCVCHEYPEAIRQLVTGTYDQPIIMNSNEKWDYPAGAFHGSEGGPC